MKWHNVVRVWIVKAPNTQIGNWLGSKPSATEADLLRIVEERLAPAVISRLISLGLERSEIDATVIPLRTLQHRRSRREKLTIEESDRVLRLIRTVSLAESVYGTRQRALEWLRKPHPRLQGRLPLSLLKTDMGSRIVEALLVQIDDGMIV
jgi:putative toxin-antitoxin system antitoxin component (TIGR02293 family)